MTDHLRVAPFTGFRYSSEKVPDLSRVIAPPYDMISPQQQQQLHERDPWNIVRLILGKDGGEDGSGDRYERAAAAYRQWKEKGILVRDAEPSIYAYRQDYEWENKSYQRLGFIVRAALTEFGEGAFPHESTLSGPKADRLRLLSACRANFSSIFSLFSDADGSVQDRLEAETASAPIQEVTDDLGVRHRLWRLSRPEFHTWIDNQMRDKSFIIADGHHRYETALEYRRLMRERPGEIPGDCDYVMMFLAPIESTGLTILPFHRALSLPDTGRVFARLGEAFEIKEMPLSGPPAAGCERMLATLEETPANRASFIFYPGEESFYLLVMKKDFDSAPYLGPGTSREVGELDVTALHQVTIQGLLGLDEQRLVQEGGISFFSRPEDAFEQARTQKDQAVFFMRPTRIEQVWKVAVSGQKMPQKSTNFYPKLTTGLVINEL
ncbi:DUF1015 domain-containing protein [bacterium]|nr:DUF1015 domain-containing protein [bacterium]